MTGDGPHSKVDLATYVPTDDAEREALSLLKERREQYIIVERLKKIRDFLTDMDGCVKRSELDRLAQKIRDQQKKKT